MRTIGGIAVCRMKGIIFKKRGRCWVLEQLRARIAGIL